jgi:hypothetical protein
LPAVRMVGERGRWKVASFVRLLSCRLVSDYGAIRLVLVEQREPIAFEERERDDGVSRGNAGQAGSLYVERWVSARRRARCGGEQGERQGAKVEGALSPRTALMTKVSYLRTPCWSILRHIHRYCLVNAARGRRSRPSTTLLEEALLRRPSASTTTTSQPSQAISVRSRLFLLKCLLNFYPHCRHHRAGRAWVRFAIDVVSSSIVPPAFALLRSRAHRRHSFPYSHRSPE